MTYADVVARARAYAERHPDNQAHARALSALDPDRTPPVQIPPGRTLDLTEARAQIANPVSSSKLDEETQTASSNLDEPNPRHRVLNV
ncbi:hypothetical protein, partial [Streptomyces sp. NPDC012510]|uniref:hypothetical protein n=1 Tax=Streptomyces sp. NPDC012510 TaxID=3364838 RepID=UPI0036E5E798